MKTTERFIYRRITGLVGDTIKDQYHVRDTVAGKFVGEAFDTAKEARAERDRLNAEPVADEAAHSVVDVQTGAVVESGLVEAEAALLAEDLNAGEGEPACETCGGTGEVTVKTRVHEGGEWGDEWVEAACPDCQDPYAGIPDDARYAVAAPAPTTCRLCAGTGTVYFPAIPGETGPEVDYCTCPAGDEAWERDCTED